MTTLDVFCDAFGWQGGTIHQAKERYAIATTKEQDRLCTVLADRIRSISDPRTALYFMEKRNENIGLVFSASLGAGVSR